MKKKISLIIIITVLLIVLMVATFFYLIKKRQEEEQTQLSDVEQVLEQITQKGSTTKTYTNTSFPLGYNPKVRTDLVKQLQANLNRQISGNVNLTTCTAPDGTIIKQLKEDGYFGDLTLAVVHYVFGKENDEVTEQMFNMINY